MVAMNRGSAVMNSRGSSRLFSSPSDDYLYPRRLSNNNISSSNENSRRFVLWFGIFMALAPWAHVYRVKCRLSSFLDMLSTLQEDRLDMEAELERTVTTLRKSKEQAEELEEINKQVLKDLKAHGDNIDNANNQLYENSEKLERGMLDRIHSLRFALKNRSERRVKLMYGEQGPYRVNVTLADGNYFVVETAPLSLAPHAVDLFLRTAVEMKLWDGMSFWLKNLAEQGGSLIMKTASAAVGTTGPSIGHQKRLEVTKDLTQLAFAEPARRYPIEMYSVVFGRKSEGSAGGPEFYINMDPRQEKTDEVYEGGETCFGKVVQGREVLDGIVKQYRSTEHNTAATSTGIASIRLVPNSSQSSSSRN